MAGRRRRMTPGGIAGWSALLLVIAVPVTFYGTLGLLGDGGPERETAGDPLAATLMATVGKVGVVVGVVGLVAAAAMWEAAASARRARLEALRRR